MAKLLLLSLRSTCSESLWKIYYKNVEYCFQIDCHIILSISIAIMMFPNRLPQYCFQIDCHNNIKAGAGGSGKPKKTSVLPMVLRVVKLFLSFCFQESRFASGFHWHFHNKRHEKVKTLEKIYVLPMVSRTVKSF